MLTQGTLRALLLSVLVGVGCGGGAGGKLMVDTPVLPYQAPDIDEITGIDSEAEEAPPPKKPAAAEVPKPAAAPAAIASPPATAQKPATATPAPAKK
jgi:hypothetical protein